MREAVREAGEVAEEGDAVLLSPACASFDEFSGGYEERGHAFKEEVAALAVGGGVA
jgi:UDP-N-acetylmuramoylalanine--D-glutamate ligase